MYFSLVVIARVDYEADQFFFDIPAEEVFYLS